MTTAEDLATLERIAGLPEPAPRVTIARATAREVRLDLGCGQNPKLGFEGVDLYGDKAAHKVDLFKFPWPFADESVDEIHSSHFLEHVHAREVEDRDLSATLRSGDPRGSMSTEDREYLGADMLFAFMDECWRIMKPGGVMEIIVPSATGDRAFQDPTHRRFFVQATFLYFNAKWRADNGLSHYRVSCNFEPVALTHSMPDEESLRSQAAQVERFRHMRNTVMDWHARLKKIPKE